MFWNGSSAGVFFHVVALKVIRNEEEVSIKGIRGWRSM